MSASETSTDPRADRGDDRWRWPRRVVAVCALAAALAFVVVAVQRAPGTSDGGVPAAADSAVVRQTPAPGSHVLRQSQVGAELLPGYDGELTVDGRRIPEDQLDGAIGPDHPGFDPELGVRPNTRSQVFFTPGPGKELERYDTSEVEVSVRFWRIADGPSTARTISWVFFVN